MATIQIEKQDLFTMAISHIKPTQDEVYLLLNQDGKSLYSTNSKKMGSTGISLRADRLLDMRQLKNDYEDLVDYYENPINKDIHSDKARELYSDLSREIERYSNEHIEVV